MTPEDTLIWLRLGRQGRGWQFFMPSNYLSADRLDALLMRTAQQYRFDKGRDYTLALGPVLCGGSLQRFTGLDDLEHFLVESPSAWPPCSPTPEDLKIWRNLCVFAFHRPAARLGREVCAESLAKAADQNDFVLMLLQMKLSRTLRPRANYIRWMDLHD